MAADALIINENIGFSDRLITFNTISMVVENVITEVGQTSQVAKISTGDGLEGVPDGKGITAIQIDLRYDPDLIDITSVTRSAYLTSLSGSTILVNLTFASNIVRIIWIAAEEIQGGPNLHLFDITYDADAEGTSELTPISATTFWNEHFPDIDITAGSVLVYDDIADTLSINEAVSLVDSLSAGINIAVSLSINEAISFTDNSILSNIATILSINENVFLSESIWLNDSSPATSISIVENISFIENANILNSIAVSLIINEDIVLSDDFEVDNEIAETLTINQKVKFTDKVAGRNCIPADGYRIYRSVVSGGPYTLVGITPLTNFTDTLPAEGTYYYVVTATDGAGNESAPSDEFIINTVEASTLSINENLSFSDAVLLNNPIATSLIINEDISFSDSITAINDLERINDDFGLYSTGAGLPTNWVGSGTETNISYSIVTDAGSPGGKALQVQKSPSDTSRVIITLDDYSGDDMNALMTFEANTSLAVGIYINYDDLAQDGFMFGIDYIGGNVKIYRVDSGSFTLLATSGSFTMSANTKYHMRFARTAAGAIMGRIWAASAQEPTTWNVSTTGATQHTSGKCAIDIWSNKVYIAKIHRVSYAKNGLQGCVLDYEDFPSECLYIMTNSDDSIRISNVSGSIFEMIGLEHGLNPRAGAIHHGDQTLYIANQTVGAGTIVRYNRYGLNRTVIDTLTVRLYGVCVKESTDQIFYSTRETPTNFVYSNHKNGGSRSQIWTEAGAFETGAIYYNGDDDRLYLAKHPAPVAMETDGSDVQTYASFSDCLTFIADDTLAYAGTWNANQLSSIPIGGGSFTSRDTTSSIWALQFNNDKSEMYAGNADGNTIVNWSAVPPSAANRSNIITGLISAADLHVAYANFS